MLVRPQHWIRDDVAGDTEDAPSDARKDVNTVVIPHVRVDLRWRRTSWPSPQPGGHGRWLGLFARLPSAAEEATIGPPELLAPRSAGRIVVLRGALHRQEPRGGRADAGGGLDEPALQVESR